jgi:hypothetical protein
VARCLSQTPTLPQQSQRPTFQLRTRAPAPNTQQQVVVDVACLAAGDAAVPGCKLPVWGARQRSRGTACCHACHRKLAYTTPEACRHRGVMEGTRLQSAMASAGTCHRVAAPSRRRRALTPAWCRDSAAEHVHGAMEYTTSSMPSKNGSRLAMLRCMGTRPRDAMKMLNGRRSSWTWSPP